MSFVAYERLDQIKNKKSILLVTECFVYLVFIYRLLTKQQQQINAILYETCVMDKLLCVFSIFLM